MSVLYFFDQRRITGIVIFLLLLSIICQIMIGVLYQKLIKQADNMAVTQNRLLKQCKLKFANCYQLNDGIINIGIYVDKFLNKIRLGGMSLIGLEHLAGQLMLLSVFVAGLGVCKGIIEGQTIGSLLPYYIVSLFGLYLYFSVSSAVDASAKRKMLKTNIVDYLENNMVNHVQLIFDGPQQEGDTDKLKEQNAGKARKAAKGTEQENKIVVTGREGQSVFTQGEVAELEELLREFLA